MTRESINNVLTNPCGAQKYGPEALAIPSGPKSENHILVWGPQWPAMKCMPAEPTANDCACFCAWKNRSWVPVSPGSPVARATYNIQKAHHFQQKNRRELAC